MGQASVPGAARWGQAHSLGGVSPVNRLSRSAVDRAVYTHEELTKAGMHLRIKVSYLRVFVGNGVFCFVSCF